MSPGRLSPRNGFTLVELLVALFITAILFAMGYGAVNQAMANKGAIEEQNRRLLEVQTTMRLMAQDFEQAVPRAVRDPVGGETWIAAFESQAAAQGSNRQAALLSVTRSGWANPAGIQRPTLQRVSYVLEDKVLHRDHAPVLDATQSTELVRRNLLTNVKSVALRFMDNSRNWVDEWPSQAIPDLPNQSLYPQPKARDLARPLAVEVTLELEDWGKIIRIFEITQ